VVDGFFQSLKQAFPLGLELFIHLMKLLVLLFVALDLFMGFDHLCADLVELSFGRLKFNGSGLVL
jgi:hypothetical protein